MARIKAAAAEIQGGKSVAAGRLYPPIINYAMPAFAVTGNNNKNDSVRIYFALSDYNSLSDINSIQLTVRYLESNENALNTTTYKGRIKAIGKNAIQLDSSRSVQKDKYYIVLNNNDLAKGFKIDQIYKIQLRTSSVISNTQPTAQWLNDNISAFSEWSTVCLIKPIAKPQITVAGMGDGSGYINYTSVDSIFTITYATGASKEPLKSWRTTLYNSSQTEVLIDSGWITYKNYDYLPLQESTNSVVFESIMPYVMAANTDYILRVQIETKNGYVLSKKYPFTCQPVYTTDFLGSIDFFINEEEGYADITTTSTDPYYTNIFLRRTSSKSNFTIWEDVGLKIAKNEVINWNFKDFTIESGIYYRYGIQICDTTGRRSPLTTLSPIRMGEFEHAFLLEENNLQLKLKYDFSISSSNITIAESKTDTIGSQYPFVRRNGNMYYRTFQCSGLITGFMDEDAHLFATKQELYHNSQDGYNIVRQQVENRVNQYDYTYERIFREKVQSFLYDNKIKLFKSLQEGNILVKLMNISLTPKNELGRLLYTFSAQAVEIDEPTLKNLQLYNIQPIGVYSSEIVFSKHEIGQISNFQGYEKQDSSSTTLIPVYTTYPAEYNILQKVGERFGYKYNSQGQKISQENQNNIRVDNFEITYLRLEMESDPYFIEIEPNGDLKPFVFANKNDLIDDENVILGWLVDFQSAEQGEIRILIQPPNNIYELNVADFFLSQETKISFPVDTTATVYYSVRSSQEFDDVTNTPQIIQYEGKIGQLNQLFDPTLAQDDVVTVLSNKYKWNNSNNTIRYSLNSLFWADIEADPGTILYAKSSAAGMPTKFVINENGNLFLNPNVANIKIDSLTFAGKQLDVRFLNPVKNWSSIPNHDTKAVSNFINLHNKGTKKPNIPVLYDFYYNSNKDRYFMYYDRGWRMCTPPPEVRTGEDANLPPYIWEITCPVRAIINYQIQQFQGTYKG